MTDESDSDYRRGLDLIRSGMSSKVKAECLRMARTQTLTGERGPQYHQLLGKGRTVESALQKLWQDEELRIWALEGETLAAEYSRLCRFVGIA